MKQYIDYILETIINDVNYFETIFNDYKWLTWIIVGVLWLWIIILKNILFLTPIWIVWNLTLGTIINKIKFYIKK